MAVVNFNIRNTKTDKVYPISAPIGERIDTENSGLTVYYDLEGARYENRGTEENPDWEISETLEYAFKKSYSVFFNYSENDLNGNYIELESEHELYDSDYWNNNSRVSCEIVGSGGRLSFALWTETEYTPEPVTRLHTSFQGASNVGWYRPNYGYPPGVTIATTSDFSPMNSVWVQDYYAPDGKKPKISFHIETAKHGDYLYPILVVSGWYGYLDGDTVKYGVRWQRAISASFAFGESKVIPGKTPSKTPNTTPAGGMGARNNFSADVPMPGADGLSGLNYFATGDNAGIHMYKVTAANWGKLSLKLWETNWVRKLAQDLKGLWQGAIKTPAEYIISAVKIGLPVTIPGAGSTETNIYIGPIQYFSAVDADNPKGVEIATRYAETDIYEFDIKPYSDTYLDFSPYTKIEVHVPYCGTAQISADACMRGKIQIKYIVDLVTGGCCAIIRTIDQFGNSKIFSVLSGQCGLSIPFNTNETTLDKIVGSIGSIGVGVASGNPMAVFSGGGTLLDTVAPFGGGKVTGLSTAGGAAAVLGDRALYVAVYHPQDITGFNDDTPNKQIDNFGNRMGYPAAWFGTIALLQTQSAAGGNAETFVRAVVDPDNIPNATAAEKEKIKNALRGGLYV